METLNNSVIQVMYLVASVLFIFSLRGDATVLPGGDRGSRGG